MNQSPKAVSPLLRIAKIATGAVLVLAVIIAVVVFGNRKPAPEKAAAIQARLELAAGEVRIDNGAGELRAVSGMPLMQNAKIRTEKGARALVRLPDGAVLFMRADSLLALAPASVRLERGEYFLNAPPTERQTLVHQLGDVAVTAADAGLSLRRRGDLGVVYVARGTATLTAKAGRVEVTAGEQASVQGSAAPRVAPLSFWDDWTGGMADAKSGASLAAGSGAIFGVDDGATPGTPARRLTVSRQAVRAVVRDGLSETEVDQTFFNPGENPVEGWYWFTVPERASISGFAVETDGVLVDGEFIESREAKAQYQNAKASGHSPAILEWVDNRSYRARIFPVPAGGQRRVVLRYIELRPRAGDKIEYIYPFGGGDSVRIGELSLSVDLGEAGTKMKIATLADARIEQNGKLVTMRRSGYTPRAPFQVEAVLDEKRPVLSLSRFATEGEGADYVMARYTPDFDWNAVKPQRAELVLIVDTSAGGDEASRSLKILTAEAILRALSDDDRFALIALDVRPRVLHPQQKLAQATDAEISRALEALADHSSGGATDLSAMFDVALGRLHGAEQPAVVYVGDGIATSGERTGEQLIERLRRAFGTSRARLFAVAAGVEADFALLSELSRAGGGQALRVSEADQATARALELAAVVKVPTITELELDLGAGLDEPFISAGGKVSRGEEVVVLARTHHDFPAQVSVRGRLGAQRFEKKYSVERDTGVLAQFVPKLWAAEYVRRLLGASEGLEAERGRIVALGLEYGLVTPFTSILALESEHAYARMGIPRRGGSRLRGVKLSALSPQDEHRLAVSLAAVPALAMPFGCSKSEAPASQTERSAAAPAAPPEMAKQQAPSPALAEPPAAAADETADKSDQPAREEEAKEAEVDAYGKGSGAADGLSNLQGALGGGASPGAGTGLSGIGGI
ncbi:MAG TPA: VIT domain-containing protein, partial [Polyangiaceae bacterium]|nr:VIT domain-containing protein [Polyangiaceae bacterium]